MILFLAPAIVAIIVMLWVLRRERLTVARGDPSTMHPLTLGMYRGCAFLGFLLFLYVVAIIVIGTLTPAPG